MFSSAQVRKPAVKALRCISRASTQSRPRRCTLCLAEGESAPGVKARQPDVHMSLLSSSGVSIRPFTHRSLNARSFVCAWWEPNTWNRLPRPHLVRRLANSVGTTDTARTVDASISDSATAAPKATAVPQAADKSVKNIAATFAPRASGNTGKNPAVQGSVLYGIFTWQAWICCALGGLLSYNLIFPSNEPDLWRLMGMWSVWMFTIPSLRARECTPAEKDWLNYAFLIVPLVNVTVPIVWKSFAAVYTADCIVLAAIFYWKVMSVETETQA